MRFTLPARLEPFAFSVISPSGRPGREKNDDLLNSAATFCQNSGVSLAYMPNWDAVDGDNAGTPAQRRSDIAVALRAAPGAVITSVGGTTAISVLGRAWLGRARAAGKWFVGFSDAAAVLNAVTFRAGLVSVYGVDLAWGLGRLCRGDRFAAFRALLADHDFGPASAFRAVAVGTAVGPPEGRAMGGCATSFLGLLGTAFDPLAGSGFPIVLFLEDVGLAPRAFEDCLYRLTQAPGFLRRCRALVLGSFMPAPGSGWTGADYVAKAVGCLGDKVPVYLSPDFGHGVANMPIPLGAWATLAGGTVRWAA